MIDTMHTRAQQKLRTELMRRMNDDWHLDGDLRADEMWLRHLVMPPPWRLALEVINPLVWIPALLTAGFLDGGPTYPTVYRRMHVWVTESGDLHRRTTGSIPPRWPQSHSWEVPDGPVAP